METHSVIFKRGPREQVYVAREIAFVFKRAFDAPPKRTILRRSRAGEVKMFDKAAAGFDRAHMLGKEHFDRPIQSRTAWKDDAQSGLNTILSYEQLQSGGVLNADAFLTRRRYLRARTGCTSKARSRDTSTDSEKP